MRIAITGFGRIGRSVLRQLLTDPAQSDIEVALLNDIAPRETCAYLFQYDSVYGPFPEPVAATEEALRVGGREIALMREHDVSALDLWGVDVLMECTGTVRTREQARRGIAAGAKNVLISGPCEGAEGTFVLGANEGAMGAANVVSNASCTTNALAPLLRALHAACGVRQGHMTTIHCYTGSQPMVDGPRGEDLARSRAGAVSMVPTTTSAMRLIDEVVPEVEGRITGAAVRVPSISVSAVDLVVTLDRMPGDFNGVLDEIAEASPVIGVTGDPCVSVDMRGRRESLVIALPETRVTGDQARIFGWYDNEWGFSARMIDMARLMAAR